MELAWNMPGSIAEAQRIRAQTLLRYIFGTQLPQRKPTSVAGGKTGAHNIQQTTEMEGKRTATYRYVPRYGDAHTHVTVTWCSASKRNASELGLWSAITL